MTTKNEEIHQVYEHSEDGHAHFKPAKVTAHGVRLIPQSSDDPRDPLNWSKWRKIHTLLIISFTSCISTIQMLSNQAGFFPQAALYHKTPTEMSYSVSAAGVGGVVGPLIWAPLSHYLGRSSLILWGCLCTIGCNIWSALMTKEDQYIAFVISRWLAGICGSASLTLGAGIVLDIFFLHERGKAFSFYTVTSLFGALAAPVFSGFIVEHASWTVQFWYCVGASGIIFFWVFFFLEDTTFDRDDASHRLPPMSYMSNRIITFFPGHRVVQARNKIPPWNMSFLIAACPPALIAGSAIILMYSWVVGLNITLAVFLQTPVQLGGYGFSAQQNALFIFAQWVSFLAAELYGFFFNDRVALWICRRRGGIWKPEYRLFPVLLLPCATLPIGLILFGVGVQYHLHYMVLATGAFLATFSDMAIVPVMNNYLAEDFKDYATETYTVLWIYRGVLGILIPFFISGWLARDGPAWVFGTMAVLSCVGISLLAVLACKGPLIRRYSFQRFIGTEEGERVVEEPQESST